MSIGKTALTANPNTKYSGDKLFDKDGNAYSRGDNKGSLTWDEYKAVFFASQENSSTNQTPAPTGGQPAAEVPPAGGAVSATGGGLLASAVPSSTNPAVTSTSSKPAATAPTPGLPKLTEPDAFKPKEITTRNSVSGPASQSNSNYGITTRNSVSGPASQSNSNYGITTRNSASGPASQSNSNYGITTRNSVDMPTQKTSNAQQGQPSYVGPTLRNVNAKTETVEGRIQNLLSSDAQGNYTNPVVQQAANRAMQSMASKGLLNSSMAQQTAIEAATSKAIEIAGPDAQTYFAQGRANQDTSNVFSRDKNGYAFEGWQNDKKLAQDESQFSRNYSLQRDQFNNSREQFDLTRGDDNRQFDQRLGFDYDQFNNSREQFDLTRGDDNRQFDQRLGFDYDQFNSSREQFDLTRGDDNRQFDQRLGFDYDQFNNSREQFDLTRGDNNNQFYATLSNREKEFYQSIQLQIDQFRQSNYQFDKDDEFRNNQASTQKDQFDKDDEFRNNRANQSDEEFSADLKFRYDSMNMGEASKVIATEKANLFQKEIKNIDAVNAQFDTYSRTLVSIDQDTNMSEEAKVEAKNRAGANFDAFARNAGVVWDTLMGDRFEVKTPNKTADKVPASSATSGSGMLSQSDVDSNRFA